MTSIWTTVTNVYDEYIASGDPRLTSWFLMGSPIPTIVLVGVYVAFVKVLGPAWMADKKPYNLRSSMFVYNMSLVIANIYLVVETVRLLLKTGSNICRIDDFSQPNGLRMAELGWWFYFLKLVEFSDTIFFILRKKFHQVSTLHLVHHGFVPIAVWFGLKAEPGSYNYFFPLINTFVHAVMYTYYGLAALGPQVQKYLWWKKYLTTIQMIQFVIVFFYITLLSFGNCPVSKFVIYLNIFLAGLFLLMFYDYFRSTYVKKEKLGNNTTLFKGPNHQQKEFFQNNISGVREKQKTG